MNSIPAITPKPSNDKKSKISEKFSTRVSKELVIGFAGPTGCGISTVITSTKDSLERLGYTVYILKLSEFIKQAIKDGTIQDPRPGKNTKGDRYLKLQDGGNSLRKEFNNAILAEYAIQEIVLKRAKSQPENNTNPKDNPPTKNAYLIDQLKHNDEVDLLRDVYRNLFFLIGVVSISSNRLQRLEKGERIPSTIAIEIMERDRQEEEDNGQKLDKTLKMSDFFVSTDSQNSKSISDHIERFCDLLHGQNTITPTHHEYGMYIAYAAGLRSACMSRQVGAAIVSTKGEILSTGCNDVPKGGGGLYSFEDKSKDKRCVHTEEMICFNDKEKSLLKDEIRSALSSLTKDSSPLLEGAFLDNALEQVFKASRIKDLIEFSRAVHAEMDALISLVRHGTEGVKGSNLYTTTFPCHSCARHIVAAGIHKTYYIEPYEKSLAQTLHSDAIKFDSNDSSTTEDMTHFIHFEGVSPSKYLHFFSMRKRKDFNGKKIEIPIISSSKSVNEFLDDYHAFEAKVVDHLKSVLP